MPSHAETSTYRVAEMTWQEIDAALDHTRTLLLPVGSTEQHGHHMPPGVDVYMPESIGDQDRCFTGMGQYGDP